MTLQGNQRERTALTWLTMSDIYLFLHKKRRFVLGTFFLSLLLFTLLFFLRPPGYIAHAMFQDSGSHNFESENSQLRKLLQAPTGKQTGGKALIWMGTYPILKKVIVQEGLQFELKSWQPIDALKLAWQSHVATNQYLKYGHVFQQIRHVNYFGDAPLYFTLHVLESDKVKLICQGKSRTFHVPSKIQFEEIEFEITHPFASQWHGKQIPIKALPLTRAYTKLKRKLKLTTAESDRNVIQLSFVHPFRDVAENVLNGIMVHYQDVLKRDIKRVIESQERNLKRRQKLLFEQFQEAMQDHVSQFERNIKDHGVMTTSEWLQKQREQEKLRQARIESIDYHLQDLQSPLAPLFASQRDDITSQVVSLLELQKKRNALGELKGSSSPLEVSKEGLNVRQCEEKWLRLNHEYDQLEMKRAQSEYFAKEVLKSHFELSALQEVFASSAIDDLIREAKHLKVIATSDTMYGEKEKKRAAEKIIYIRNHMASHLNDLEQHLREEKKRLESQISQAKTAFAGALDREIASLEDQNRKLFAEKKELLTRERALIDRLSDKDQKHLASIPSQWMSENLLKIKSDLNYSVLESLSQLVESTSVKYHMMQIKSRPIEFGLSFPKPYTFPFFPQWNFVRTWYDDPNVFHSCPLANLSWNSCLTNNSFAKRTL